MAVDKGETIVRRPECIEPVPVLVVLRTWVREVVHVAEDTADFPAPGRLDGPEAGFEIQVYPIFDPVPTVGVGGGAPVMVAGHQEFPPMQKRN
jgi:hypothetical protein